MTTLLQDLRFAWRMMLKDRGLTTVAVVTLALGIGANTATFSLLKAVVLRPLPGVHGGDDLGMVVSTTRAGRHITLSYPDYADLRDGNEVFSGLAASSLAPLSLSDEGRAERVWGEFVSGNLFDVLGVGAALGRTLLPSDAELPAGQAVAVLSHGFWRRRFGSDPGIVGRTVRLNGHPVTVVGVARKGYRGSVVGLSLDIFVPLTMQGRLRPDGDAGDVLQRRNTMWLVVQGRLGPGISFRQAQASMKVLSDRLARDYPDEDLTQRALLVPLWRAPFGAQPYMFPILSTLMVVVGLVLLIACANVANLLLARAVSRRREIAIRLALGGGRGRLVRQLLTESLLLALVGGTAGLLLAVWTADLLSSPPVPTPLPMALDTGLDGLVLSFTLLATVVSALVFGLVPAVQASKLELVPVLKDDASSRRNRPSRLRGFLVVAQVSVSLVLLVAASLLVRSEQKARRIDPGFDAAKVLVATLDLAPAAYGEDAGGELYRRLGERVGSLPGVESAAFARFLPLLVFGGSSQGVEVEGYEPRRDEDLSFYFNVVSPGYFRTLGIPLLEGRDFSARDGKTAPDVVIVNETLARTFWPGQSPVGRRLRTSGRWREVIGVARDAKYVNLSEAPQPYVYLPSLQNHQSEMTLHVRTAADPGGFLPAVRDVVGGLDADLPVLEAGTLADRVEFALLGYDMGSSFLGVAGLLALLLASLGIYGVVAHSASQRTRELGIRVALGAKRRDIFRLVVGQGMRLTSIGIVLGLVASLVLSRFLERLLFGVSATDPLIFGVTALLLSAVAFLACHLPARRATRVDPMVALRYE